MRSGAEHRQRPRQRQADGSSLCAPCGLSVMCQESRVDTGCGIYRLLNLGRLPVQPDNSR
jgi:hypothetical protein